jgi:hypothetical protein
MAVEALLKKSLVLSFQEGMDEDGEPIVKRYTYSNVVKSATPDALYEAAQALVSLYDGTVDQITTVDTNDLF